MVDPALWQALGIAGVVIAAALVFNFILWSAGTS
jgi:hypothetical protein